MTKWRINAVVQKQQLKSQWLEGVWRTEIWSCQHWQAAFGSTHLQADVTHTLAEGWLCPRPRALSTSGLEQKLAREGMDSCFCTELLGKGEMNCQGHAKVFPGKELSLWLSRLLTWQVSMRMHVQLPGLTQWVKDSALLWDVVYVTDEAQIPLWCVAVA